MRKRDKLGRGHSRSPLRAERGGSLPGALVALAVGAILMAPFLAHVSSRMLGTRALDGNASELYAADSGVEFASWRLLNDSGLQASVDAAYPNPVAIGPAITVNGLTPSITAAAVNPRGWISLANTPDSVNQGGDLSFAGGSLYAFQWHGNDMVLWEYDITGDGWTTITPGPSGVHVKEGSAIAYPGGHYLFALLGNKSDELWRYDLSADYWARMDDPPDEASAGSDMEVVGSYIYVLQGGKGNGNGKSSDGFWRYSWTGNFWETRHATPDDVGEGGALAYDGSYIYALAGGGSSDFWRYNIGSDSWISRASTPGGVGDGGALAFTGNGTLHALQGDSTAVWSYDITSNAWQARDPVPSSVGRAGSLTWDQGDFVYALQGNNSTGFWRYLAAPPKYDISAQAGSTSLLSRIQLINPKAKILWWDIQ